MRGFLRIAFLSQLPLRSLTKAGRLSGTQARQGCRGLSLRGNASGTHRACPREPQASCPIRGERLSATVTLLSARERRGGSSRLRLEAGRLHTFWRLINQRDLKPDVCALAGGGPEHDARQTVDGLSEGGVRVHCLALSGVDLNLRRWKEAIAEFERDLLRERTAAGIERAKAEGK
jgi:hypothetical protein